MEIILRGGPYDGETKKAPVMGSTGKPYPFFNLYPPVVKEHEPISDGNVKYDTKRVVTYQLEEIWEDKVFKCYEYQYQYEQQGR